MRVGGLGGGGGGSDRWRRGWHVERPIRDKTIAKDSSREGILNGLLHSRQGFIYM